MRRTLSASSSTLASCRSLASLVSVATIGVLAAGCGSSSSAPTSPTNPNDPSGVVSVPAGATGATGGDAGTNGGSAVTKDAGTNASTTPETDATKTAAGPSEADVQADVRAANTFALKAYGKARKTPGNLMLSGTSLRHALTAAYVGARGETAREMATVLELPTDVQKAASLANAENAAWQAAKGKDDDGAKLVVADRVWTDKAFNVLPDYAKLVDGELGASVAPLDFATTPEDARKSVNQWVAEKTADKIQNLLPAGSVDKRTRVVITNAIYFKGKWSLPFTKEATKEETFTAIGGKKVKTPLMHATETQRFAQTANAKVLEMRYQGSDMSMVVVLPNDVAGLAKLEEGLTVDAFEGWTKALASGRVAVTLPKFTFAAGGSMTTALQDLGMKSAFSTRADFTGIAPAHGADNLSMSQVFHKTWVAVDEAGTEAAAATGAVMHTTSMPIGPINEFKADHPFLFFLRDAKSGRILFVGRVTDPKAS